MRSTILAAAIFLAACSPDRATVTFDRAAECAVTPTTETRMDRRQGACIVYVKSGNAMICTAWNHYNVTQHRQVLSCRRDEWVDQ